MRQNGTTFSEFIIFLLKCCVHSSDSVGDENVLKGNGQIFHTGVKASVKPTGTEGSVLTQVQLLSGSSTWLLLVSVLLTLSLVVSLYWMASYMECRVVVPPSLCSAAVEVGSPARTYRLKHTFPGASLPREFYILSFSESFLAVLTHASIKSVPLNAEV